MSAVLRWGIQDLENGSVFRPGFVGRAGPVVVHLEGQYGMLSTGHSTSRSAVD